jgi:glycosyltransferase involved in cell wall biosynthesis
MGKKIKVLVNTSTFKSNKDEPIPEFINKLLDNLKQQNSNLEFKVLKPMNGNEKSFAKLENYEIHSYRYFFPLKFQDLSNKGIKPSLEINKFNIFKVFLLCISQFFSLLKLTILYKPDVIYCHWFLPQVIITFLVSKIIKVKFIFTSHGSDVLLLNNLGKAGSNIVRIVTNSAYKYSAVSSLVMNEINKNLNINNNNSKVIPMGLDNRFYEMSFKKKIKTGKIKFLYIGRLIDYKGVDILLNSLALYKDTNNNFQLDILGTGTYLNELKNLSGNLGLDEHVNFAGFKSFNQKTKYIEECDLIIIPSKVKKGQIEGGPLTLVEGMSMGKVCIVSNSIGFIEHCNNGNSIIFESGNSESLLKAILKFESLTDLERNKLSSSAKKMSNKFSFEEIGRKHNEFFFGNE